MRCYRRLATERRVDPDELAAALAADLSPHQFATLAFRLCRASHDYDALVARELGRAGEAAPYLARLFPALHSSGDVDERLLEILLRTGRAEHLRREALTHLVTGIVHDTIPVPLQALWLTKVFEDGLHPDDVDELTLLMRDSGAIYDYRGHPELDRRRILRRYPTGALSEKTALILPSLLSAFREHPIASPFLVARSLGYTGGTWDKLRAIPGFTFLAHGNEAIDAMRRCGVSMTVTHDDVDPADRKLYQLRSMTGTVESPELIIASIGSKQLAIPADFLLLDVRFGAGAFLETEQMARDVAGRIVTLLMRHGIPTETMFTDTPQPNGMSVGNALEVLEAIAVMGGPSGIAWDRRALKEQRELVIAFFERLMQHEVGESAIGSWARLARQKFASGDVFRAFLDVLRVHRVPGSVAESIALNPDEILVPRGPASAVRAIASGVVCAIDQHRLGYAVNVGLGGGGNDYGGEFNALAGLQLTKRLGDCVTNGEPLCWIYGAADAAPVAAEVLASLIIDHSRAPTGA